MTLLRPPFASKLEKAERILIAGAGGGFDFFGGLPLYFALVAQGKAVYLANFSFTQLEFFEGEWITESMMRVTAQTKGLPGIYFPEWHLCRWFEQQGQDEMAVFAFNRTGVLPLVESYEALVARLQLDTVLLVDGGTDSLMRGDEDGLGTPGEDLTSITAVAALDIPQKMLMCLGFGVDHYHGVSNDLSLAAIAELAQSQHFLGSTSLLNEMPEVQQYRAAVEYVFAAMPNDVSIVSSSILSALSGYYGNHHATERTAGSKLWINPLMAICWFFDLEGIVKRNLIVAQLGTTDSFRQVRQRILAFRTPFVGKLRYRETLPD